ncbi:hypothetical protein VOLCADRAFT_100401 [Volvox carteri f. nagariensis]|uniref:Uncharacterized protein n=1 Tax=Volvox carteri f. nagariensis TaxID=3068 RepID=D8UK44_VOLCA|nr:uncharacterized protein VOLCADRAFT_100401 [Volvox carteri f. nagariensis]EFJ39888.1 hypothetical protein VOLCADRAFT_100401 [Volvox carteri f. nagariensis]|eukprot:XP_002959027.1 hypothetical protein VOLCADRAFT_100401 [Volvox carteri f. nagariensis]
MSKECVLLRMQTTSSNLERFKLTAEEQERRKASRVSKNRPLASLDSKRGFVEAWAKHVSAGGLHEDTEPDQDRPRSGPLIRDLAGINFGSVVEMLRRSPSAAAGSVLEILRKSPSAASAAAGSVREMLRKSPSAAATAAAAAAAATRGRPPGVAACSDEAAHKSSRSAAAVDDFPPSRPQPRSRSRSQSRSRRETSSAVAAAASYLPSTETSSRWVPSNGSLMSTAAGGQNCGVAGEMGPGADRAAAADAPESTAATTGTSTTLGSASGMGKDRAAAEALVAAAGAGGGGENNLLRRADVSITPVELRPRYYNPADATTIIAYGDNSEDEEGDEGPSCTSSDAGKKAATMAAGAAAGGGGGGAGGLDPMTAAFEAALFHERFGGVAVPVSAADGGGGGGGDEAALAWATSRDHSVSPIGTAAVRLLGRACESDVERRLRAVEAALAGHSKGGRLMAASGRGRPPGGGGGSDPQQMTLQEEVTELRRELRQVQTDNAKLRQELGAFSTHASALMTQLQAQVQQLLRGSNGGDSGSSTTAGVGAAAKETAGRPFVRQQSAPSGPGAAAAAASIPTTLSAANFAAASSHLPYGGLYETRPLPQPYQPAVVAPPDTSQPSARRSIFSDLDFSSLRPLGTAAPTRSVGAGPGDAATPLAAATYWPTGSFTPAGAAAASPLIDVASMPSGLYTAPVRDMDESDVVLPSFSAFRRTACTLAFTASRPAASGGPHSGPLTSPHQSATTTVPVSTTAAGPNSSRPSPAGAHTSNMAAVQPRPLPTQYQTRSLGEVMVRPGGSLNSMLSAAAPPTASDTTAPAAAGAGSGAYVASLSGSAAAAMATGSDAAAAALARSHSGLPQPLVFCVGPEFRTARATGLSAENSMSLSAHTAAATAARAKSSLSASSGTR